MYLALHDCPIISPFPACSLALSAHERVARAARHIDSIGKTQISANTLQSQVQPSGGDAHSHPLKRLLINYEMTRRNKRCALFDGRSPYNALLLHCDGGGGQRILLLPALYLLGAK